MCTLLSALIMVFAWQEALSDFRFASNGRNGIVSYVGLVASLSSTDPCCRLLILALHKANE